MDKDGRIGSFRGHDIYYIDPNRYFENRENYDNTDVIWCTTDKDVLIHRGKFYGLKRGNSVTFKQASLSDYYRQAEKKVPVKVTVEELKDALNRGNPTSGKKKTVTERHTVDWYTEYTVKMLNEGVHYGEQRLHELAAEGSRRVDALGDRKAVT